MRSGDADLTASGTAVRSTVQVQSSLRENDFLWKRLRALCVAVLDRLLRLTSWPRCLSLVVPLPGTSAELSPIADVDGELLFLGAGADPRSCCDHAAPAGSGARLPGVGANSRLRRDYAAPAVSAAIYLGVGRSQFSPSTRRCRCCWCLCFWCRS